MGAVIAPLLFWISPTGAGEDAELLRDYLSGLETLEARFVQTVDTQAGNTGPAAGTFYLMRPGRFRWDYDGETGPLIVADGRRVWLLDRELQQVSHQSQEAALRGTTAQLLAGDGDLDEFFDAKGAGRHEGLDWVDLRPRDEESQFALVRVAFQDGVLQRLEMLDNFGQYTRFVFTGVRRNPTLAEGLFQFEPPPGWDVFQTH